MERLGVGLHFLSHVVHGFGIRHVTICMSIVVILKLHSVEEICKFSIPPFFCYQLNILLVRSEVRCIFGFLGKNLLIPPLK
jgi:hypothetical protein